MTMSAALFLPLALVTFVAAGIQSATGFGFGLLAAPIFLILLDSPDAIPIVIVLTLAISLALLGSLWRAAPRRALKLLGAGSVAGFPLGILAFEHLGLDFIRIVVAFVVILSATHALARLRGFRGDSRAGAPPRAPALIGIGAASGAMTTCLGMPGPPVMAYLSAIGQQKDEIRATLISLFVFSYTIALVLQAGVVGVADRVWWLSAILVPVALAGTLVGHRVSPRISQRVFQSLVIVALFATGAYMLATSLWR